MNGYGKMWRRVAIIGVGLIGGSVGLALRERGLAAEVIGIGRRDSSLRLARRVGAITHATRRLAAGVKGAELVVVCTPVELIAAHVREAAAACPQSLLTDAGSIKAALVAELEETLPPTARFVGSHPLAGSEKNGPGEARADLFAGRIVIVTPTRKTAMADADAVAQFWQALGATVVRMTPEKHDASLAVTSHLPHVIAAAAAVATPDTQLDLCGSGWADTTRIAAGDPELWTQILLGNREHVLAALDRFDQSIERLRTAIERGNRTQLRKLLAEAQRKRHALGN